MIKQYINAVLRKYEVMVKQLKRFETNLSNNLKWVLDYYWYLYYLYKDIKEYVYFPPMWGREAYGNRNLRRRIISFCI